MRHVAKDTKVALPRTLISHLTLEFIRAESIGVNDQLGLCRRLWVKMYRAPITIEVMAAA